MSSQRLDEEAIFHVAREITNAEARERYLVQVCADDESLRKRIEDLLAVHEQESKFLKSASAPDATVDQPSLADATGQQFGPYKLLQQIGEGGFGVVYMAEQKEPVKRRVALKIIKPGMDTRQVIARFEAERQALAMMDHPNIARALDVGMTDTGRPYFVIELVKGMPITQYCDEHHLSPRERLEMFVPVCLAVQHAHQKGIIHRDIKPSNILVAEYDNQAVPKIIDFGVAKALSQQLTEKTMFTQYGQVIGTLEYMSPEQAKVNQLDVDTRSDIYSLGVVLYELLTGTTPFDKQRLRTAAMDELLRIIREEEPPRPSVRLSSKDTLPSVAANRNTEPRKLSLSLRGELDWIVMRALDKERARRYETASALADDVRRYLADEAVVACPPSVRYRFSKFTRRNRAAISTALIVLSCLLAGLIGTGWEASRRMRAEESLEQAELALTPAEASEARANIALEEANKQKQMALESEREAMHQRREADEQRKIAEQQRELAERERQRAVAAQSITHEDLIQERDRVQSQLESLRELVIERAMLQAVAGEFEQLQQTIEQAKAIGVPEDWLLTFRGVYHIHQGQNKQAIEPLQRALEINSANVSAKAMLSLAYFHNGDWDEWAVLSPEIKQLEPRPEYSDFDSLFIGYGWFYIDYAKSAKKLEAVLNKHRSWYVPRMMLAGAWAHAALAEEGAASAEKVEKALAEVQVPRQLAGDNPFVISGCLYVYNTALRTLGAGREDVESAAEELAHKLDHHPDYPVGGLIRAQYYEAVGEEGGTIQAWHDTLAHAKGVIFFWPTAALLLRGEINPETTLKKDGTAAAAIAQAYLWALSEDLKLNAKALTTFDDLKDQCDTWVMRHTLIRIPLLLQKPEIARQQAKQWLEARSTGNEGLDDDWWDKECLDLLESNEESRLNVDSGDVNEQFYANYQRGFLRFAEKDSELLIWPKGEEAKREL